jgi:hypothetical protein
MTNPVCPTTGAPMQRGVRPMTLDYKGARAVFEMPGWYCYAADESIHTGEDVKVSDRPPQSPLTASSTPPSSTKCRTSGARSRIAASARSTGTGQPSSPTWMRACRFLNWRATPRGCSSGRNRARNAACSTSYYRTWLTSQSRANRSPGRIPCYQGK